MLTVYYNKVRFLYHGGVLLRVGLPDYTGWDVILYDIPTNTWIYKFTNTNRQSKVSFSEGMKLFTDRAGFIK